MSFYRIGVDVGGTNTDAAILDVTASDTESRGVLASYKASTTSDITSGIIVAIKAVLEASKVDFDRVIAVTIATTHFINALIEADAEQLSRVAVVRLCGPFTRQIPPFSDFPNRLRSILDGGSFFLNGGLEYNGDEIQSLDQEQVRQTTREIVDDKIHSVAIVGVFSPLDHTGLQEEACKRIMLEVDPDLEITISRDVGPCGLLERENATILNSAVLRTHKTVVAGFRRAMENIGLQCPLYLSRNDGTIIGVDAASDLPITTFASGPTNSMIGAAFLAGYGRRNTEVRAEAAGATVDDSSEPQVLVMDIGGTTTDVCALLPSGLPRQAPGFTQVAGVRTTFSMPEVCSVGLGGGSVVTVNKETGNISLGPASVGHFLTQDALVYGGNTTTATDIIVGIGKAELGNSLLAKEIAQPVIHAAQKSIKKTLEDVVDRMRVSAAPVHLLLVGGGALLVTEDLNGVEKCIRPNHQGAANAVGAAISEISGEVDVIEILQGRSEKDIVAATCEKAVQAALERGAAKEGIRIVDITKTPLQYVNNGAIRIQVRAIGRLKIPDTVPVRVNIAALAEPADRGQETQRKTREHSSVPESLSQHKNFDITTYRPEVTQGVWFVSSVDIDFISTGCGVLGTGGGGSTHHEALRCRELLQAGNSGRMRIISPESLKDDDLIGFGSWYGAPSVGTERIANGNEISVGLDALLKVLGGKKLNGFLVDEIGGGNGLSAFPTAVQYDLPVVDGDTMGRAYPTMYHATTSVYGHSLTPCALTDCRGNVCILMGADSPLRVEKVLRSTAIELGLGCAVCANPLSGKAIKSHAVPRTLSLAWYIGRAIHIARREKSSYMTALTRVCGATSLFAGKIVDVQRHVRDGYTQGSVLLASLGTDDQESAESEASSPGHSEKRMIIPFQNEYIYAAWTDGIESEADEVICTVPELISILGQDGEAIGSQDLRYGMHVNVVALPAHSLWKTPEALKVGGPEGFGLDIPFVGIGRQAASLSVIENYGRWL